MKILKLLILLCSIMFLGGTEGFCASFDERLWQKYAEIASLPGGSSDFLVAVNLDGYQLGDLYGTVPFADLRVVSDRKEEIPYQIVSKKPVVVEEEFSSQMRNLSTTDKGDTWVELTVDQMGKKVNALQIMTSTVNYMRQVQVFGSQDGKTWNMILNDGVVFDMIHGEKLQNTRITLPESIFPHLAIKIINNGAQPLVIEEIKALQHSNFLGQSYAISGSLSSIEVNGSRKENSVVVQMQRVFPIDRLILNTLERNFQRFVTVQVRGKNREWIAVAGGTVFSFDSPTMHSSQLEIELPEIAAKEFRLVFKNFDSPPLSLTNVVGKGYTRLLVFKRYPGRRLYLFWGNPLAEKPHYDIAGAVTPQSVEQLAQATLGPVHENASFLGEKARQPFTERYKVLLYVVVSLAIIGLLLLQYQVFKRAN